MTIWAKWTDQKTEEIIGNLLRAGVLLLIATPVVRVAFSVFAFALEKDRMYVIFTLIVLSVLMYSLLGA